MSQVSPAESARSSVKIPFDVSYPAHLKVLLGYLARSTAPGLTGPFSLALKSCLDYLLRYWTAVLTGALQSRAELGIPLPENVNDWADAVRILRYSVFAWDAFADHPVRVMVQEAFFEVGEDGRSRPLEHTRWLGIAGQPLEDEISVEDLGRWSQVSPRLAGLRQPYLSVLASWLRHSRTLCARVSRSYQSESLLLKLDGEPVFAAIPTIDFSMLGFQLTPEQIVEAERSPRLPSFLSSLGDLTASRYESKSLPQQIPSPEPAGGAEPEPSVEAEPSLELDSPEPESAVVLEMNAPGAFTGLQFDTMQLDSLFSLQPEESGSLASVSEQRFDLPQDLPEVLRPSFELLQASLRSTASQDGRWRSRAEAAVACLADLLGLYSGLVFASLATLGPIPEQLRSALASMHQPEQGLKLFHYALANLRVLQGRPAAALVREAFYEVAPVEVARLHARWLGLPDNPMQGLNHLAWWTRLARQGLASVPGGEAAGISEAQLQLRELLDSLQLWLVTSRPLWSDPASAITRRPDGLLGGKIVLGGSAIELDSVLPELLPPLEEILAAARIDRSAPFYQLDEVYEFVERVAFAHGAAPERASGLLVHGPAGVGKTRLLQALAREHRPVGGRPISWVQAGALSPLWLECVNESLEWARRTIDSPWFALGPAALADIRRRQPEQPFSAYLEALAVRNPPGENAPCLVLLVDDLVDLESSPWTRSRFPERMSWLAASEEELPQVWPGESPARVPISLQDPAYLRSVQDAVSAGWSAGNREEHQSLLEKAHHNLLTSQLYAGAMARGWAASVGALPDPEALLGWLTARLGAKAEQRRLPLLLALAPDGLSVSSLVAAGTALAAPLHTCACLFRVDQKIPQGRSLQLESARWFVWLAHPSFASRLVELYPAETLDAARAAVRSWMTPIERGEWPEGLDLATLFTLAARAEDAPLWLQVSLSGALRMRREQICAEYDRQGRQHRKVEILDLWLRLLELVLAGELEEANRQALVEERCWAWSSRALTYRSLGYLERAHQDVQLAVEGFEAQSPRLLNGLAAAYNRRSEILRELGHLEDARQDSDRAVSVWEQVLEQGERRSLEPLLGLTLSHRGSILAEQGRLELAEADLNRALQLYRPHQDELSARLRLDLAATLRQRGRLALRRDEALQSRDDSQHALQLLDRFQEDWVELQLERALVLQQLAESLLQLEDVDRALEHSDQAAGLWRTLVAEGRLDLRPLYLRELNRRGQLLSQLGRLEEGLAVLQPAVELHLQLVEVEGRSDLVEPLSQSLVLRGHVWQRLQKPEAAKRDYSLAYHYLSMPVSEKVASGMGVQARSSLIEAGSSLAALHLQLGEYEQAIAQARNTLALLDGESGNAAQLGEKRAGLHFLLARALAPSDPEQALLAHDLAVMTYAELVDEQGLYHLLPRLAESHLARSRTRLEQGILEASREDADTAVELLTYMSNKGGDPAVLAILGPARLEAADILRGLGQPEQALVHLEAAIAELGVPASVEGFFELAAPYVLRASIYAGLHDHPYALADLDAAVEAYSRALELAEDSVEVRFRLANTYFDRARLAVLLGDPDRAVQDVLAGNGLDPEPQDSWHRVEPIVTALEAQAHGAEPMERVQLLGRLIEFLVQARSLASPADSYPALVRAYRQRALAAQPEARAFAREDLTRALRLATLLNAQEHFLTVSQLYENRAELASDDDLALLDLGRAIETMERGVGANREIETGPELEKSWLRLYATRRELLCKHGEVAPEWQDLEVLRERLTAHEHDPGILSELVEVHRRRAEILREQGAFERARDDLREAARWLKRILSDSGAEVRAAVQQRLVQTLLSRCSEGEPDADAVVALTDALMIVLAARQEGVPAQEWYPISLLRGALRVTEPERIGRLAELCIRLLEQAPLLPDSWFELAPLCVRAVLQSRSALERLAPLLDCFTDLCEQGRDTPFVGESLQLLLELPDAELERETSLLQALQSCARSWSAQSSQVRANAAIPERLQDWA